MKTFTQIYYSSHSLETEQTCNNARGSNTSKKKEDDDTYKQNETKHVSSTGPVKVLI